MRQGFNVRSNQSHCTSNAEKLADWAVFRSRLAQTIAISHGNIDLCTHIIDRWGQGTGSNSRISRVGIAYFVSICGGATDQSLLGLAVPHDLIAFQAHCAYLDFIPDTIGPFFVFQSPTPP